VESSSSQGVSRISSRLSLDSLIPGLRYHRSTRLRIAWIQSSFTALRGLSRAGGMWRMLRSCRCFFSAEICLTGEGDWTQS